ncbi:TPA: DUF1329 domain-containing protein [Pseudomonas aeruginosa]
MILNRIVTTALACVAATVAYAAPNEAEITKLGNQLTPIGAEAGPSSDGAIPAHGAMEMKAPAGWVAGGKPVDPFSAEKPIYVISAENVDQYKNKLSLGQYSLIKSLSGYRMEVFPSHRTCGVPATVADQTKKNATVAALDGEDRLVTAVGGGYPFPLPKSGSEVIWNHKLRYSGPSVETTVVNVIPPKGAKGAELGEVQLYLDEIHFPMAAASVTNPADAGYVESALREQTLAPSSAAGDGVASVAYLNRPTEANLYFSAQRRMRRAPNYQFDAPILNTDNLLMSDQAWMFNGSLERYDFKLVGKRELLIPYNNVAMYDHTAKVEDVFQGEYVKRNKVRYELHRVWEVEATVKAGKRHSVPKRVFYVDEDTWIISVQDLYDGSEKVWRSMEAYLAPEYSIGACFLAGNTLYDIPAGRYVGQSIVAASGKPTRFSNDLKISDFTADAFRRWIGR